MYKDVLVRATRTKPTNRSHTIEERFGCAENDYKIAVDIKSNNLI